MKRTAELASPGYALVALGCGHVGWGLKAYHRPLGDLVRAGVVRSVGDGIFDTDHDRGPRAAAFWFMLAAPLMMLVGYLAESALESGDAQAARTVGRATVGVGAVGAAVMPRSGFAAAMPIGWWLVRRSRSLP
jgi:hypothetical protein